MTDDLRTLLRSLPTGAAASPHFDVTDLPASPLVLFDRWLRDAITAGCDVPHAATLATTGPDARTLIVKDVTDDGFWFATRADGRKAAQLADDPRAALVFFWREQGRQVRVRGTVTFASRDASLDDFRARPAASRAAASLGRQSTPLPSTVDYAAALEDALALATTQPSAGSENWRAAVLVPELVEFWASTASDGQVRVEYRREPDGWSRTRLWP